MFTCITYLALFALAFFYIAQKSDMFFYLSLLAPRPPTSKYLGGRQRHLLMRSRGDDPTEDAWRRS